MNTQSTTAVNETKAVDGWAKFPNGKVWRVNDGVIAGTIVISGYLDIAGLEAKLDAISEDVTGSIVGLTNFTYDYRGNDTVTFSGDVSQMLASEDEEVQFIDPQDDSLWVMLAAQYHLDESEVRHARMAQPCDVENEDSLELYGSVRELRFPPYPQTCSYVRVVIDGLEVEKWTAEQLGNAPADVMRALISAAQRS